MKPATHFWSNIDEFKKEHKADILAVKAMKNGAANEMQQKRVFAFIIKTLCRADDLCYYPSERDTSFALGRRAVGQMLRGIALDSDYVEKNL